MSKAKRSLIDKYFEEMNELLLKRRIQGTTNEKVKFVEIYALNTDYYEENYSQTAVHRCFIVKVVLKIS